MVLRDITSAATLLGVAWLIYRLEKVMANFDALNAKLDEEDAARTAAQERATAEVNAELQALRDTIAGLQLDTADQAAVDAAVGRVQQNVDAWNTFEPLQVNDQGELTGGAAAGAGGAGPSGPAGPAGPAADGEPADGGQQG